VNTSHLNERIDGWLRSSPLKPSGKAHRAELSLMTEVEDALCEYEADEATRR